MNNQLQIFHRTVWNHDGKYFSQCPDNIVKRSLLYLTIILIGWFSGAIPLQAAPLRHLKLVVIGSDQATVKKHWQPTLDYLNRQLPEYRFTLIAYSYYNLHQISYQKICANDLFITNPVEYFSLLAHKGFTPLATLVVECAGFQLNCVSGAIVTKAERTDINSIRNLANLEVAAVSSRSLSGWLLQRQVYRKAGIPLASAKTRVTFTGNAVDVLKYLDLGKADVGFIPSGVLEKLSEQGTINPTHYKVLPPLFPGRPFPLLHSTPVYPGNLIAFNHRSVSEAEATLILRALLRVKSTDQAAMAGGYSTWSVAPSYQHVKQSFKAMGLIKNLRLSPFSSFIYAFRYPLLIIFGILFIALLNYYRRLQRLNQGMDRYLKRQAELIKEQLMIKTELDYAKDEETTILENISDGVIYIDRRMKVIWGNGVIAEFLHLQPKDLLGKPENELWGALDDEHKNEQAVKRALKTRQHIDTVLQLSDGRTLEVSVEPVFDKKQAVKGVVETFKDVTLRNQTEKQLRDGQRLYELTMNAINEGIYDYDCQKECFTYSGKLLEILGYKDHQLDNSFAAWRQLVHPDDRHLLSCFTKTVRFSCSIRMQHQDGSWRWMLCRGMPVEVSRDNQPLRIVGTITNIQQRKIAEEMLRREKERLALIIKASGLGFWTWDFTAHSIELDENWLQMIGYDLVNRQVKESFWRDNIHVDDLAGFDTAIKQLRNREEYNYSFRIRHKQGHWVWLHGVGKVTKRDKDGQPLIMVGMHQNITAQKQREQAIAIEARQNPGQQYMAVPQSKKEILQTTKQPEHNSPQAESETGKAVALVVEDNAVNLTLLKALLKKLNIAAVAAENGREALTALQRGSFNFILMDCQMPIMDGYETTRRIRASQAAWSNIPIIAMTANAMVGDEEKCFAAGMDDYISKPVNFALLKKVINKYLGPSV